MVGVYGTLTHGGGEEAQPSWEQHFHVALKGPLGSLGSSAREAAPVCVGGGWPVTT